MKYVFVTILMLSFLQTHSQTSVRETSFYGPVKYEMPFGADKKSPEGKKYELNSIFNNLSVNEDAYNYNSFPVLNLSRISAIYNETYGLVIKSLDTQHYELFIQNIYLENPEFCDLKLKVVSNSMFSISSNGETLLENLKKPDSLETKEKSKEMIKGFHPLMIRILSTPEQSEIQFKMTIENDSLSEDVIIHSEKSKPFIDLLSLANMPSVSSADINFDGTKAVLRISKKSSPKGKSESWLEFWDLKSRTLIRSFRGLSDETSVEWVPGKDAVSYIKTVDKKKSIWIHPLNAEPEVVLNNIEDLASYTWSDKGDFIIYSITNKPEKKDQKTNLLDGMASRLPGYYNYSYLYKLDIASGKINQLTYGKNGTGLSDISADGTKIIFTTSQEDYSQLPYSYSTYWQMDLNSGKTDSLFTSYWTGSCDYFPEANKLLISGGPSAFGKLGENIKEGQRVNGYDGQAYIYDLQSKEVTPITKDFDPAIGSFEISPDGSNIFFICTDKDYRSLYKYSIDNKTFAKLIGAPDLIRSMAFSSDGKKALITGSKVQGESAAYLFDSKKMEAQLLYDPSKKILKDKNFGDIKTWTFENENGDVIDGRYYLPLNFDSTKKYPTIVYYYGGTTPVSRSFGGRYPYNWYAAQGYVVYIMQPSGTMGYGQEFSASHVNNWGKTTAKDIIMGTEKFVEAHSFVDKDALGCIGASYGGFMTMYLTTQTDIFSAAVSHAGISALSSYWGEGYWGYAYSAVASEDAFPWNRKDIYVDQSPLFQADKVNTPILLTHGTSDTNVPPGESYQFYTALKILGKEVEMLEVPGQNHWVVDYEQYIEWKYSIIAWFDKHLKKQDEWWESKYGE